MEVSRYYQRERAHDMDSREIELVLSRFAGYDDVPYAEGEPTRIKQDDVDGWQRNRKYWMTAY